MSKPLIFILVTFIGACMPMRYSTRESKIIRIVSAKDQNQRFSGRIRIDTYLGNCMTMRRRGNFGRKKGSETLDFEANTAVHLPSSSFWGLLVLVPDGGSCLRSYIRIEAPGFKTLDTFFEEVKRRQSDGPAVGMYAFDEGVLAEADKYQPYPGNAYFPDPFSEDKENTYSVQE